MKANLFSRFHVFAGALVLCAGLPVNAPAEVQSLALGIDLSPYGLSEHSAELREELEKFPGIQSVSEEPCLKTEIFEVRPRGGRLLDAKELDAFIRNTGLGTRLRGIEATVDGWLDRRGEQPVLRVSATDELLSLAPLTTKVQWDLKKKKPHPRTLAERQAYKELLRQWDREPRRVRLIGPLVEPATGAHILEVRQFEFQTEAVTAAKDEL